MEKRQRKYHSSSDLSRRQGVREIKQSFLIVCEGEKTEPDYFKAFRMTAATVKAVGQAMNTMTLVSKAISIRDADRQRKKVYDQFLLSRQQQAIKNAETVLATISHGNPAEEESSTTVQTLVIELNKFL